MKKKSRILLAYILVVCFTGAAVYAEPVPSDAPEAGSSEQSVIQDDDATDATEEKEEGSTEKPEEPTEEPTELRTENPTETPTERKTEDQTESTESTESTEENTAEGTEQTTEEGSSTTLTPEQQAALNAALNSQYYNSAQISALRLKYAENVQATQKVRNMLNEMKRNQNTFIESLQQMDEEIIALQTQLDTMEEERKKIDATLAQMQYELEFAEQDVQAQYQKLKDHIQNSYENGNYSFLDAVLHSANFSDILNKTEYVQQVSLYDSLLLIKYKAARQQVANKMRMLESMTEDYGAMQVYYQDQQEAIVMLSDEKEKQIIAFQNEIDEQQQDLTKLEILRQEEANEIARLEAQARAAALAAQQAAQNGNFTGPSSVSRDPIVKDIVPYDGEIFVWPQPSNTRITSDYGWRGDIGIAGASKDHKGIDIGASMGESVIAAAAGKVTIVAYSGARGYYIVVDHGNGYATLYQHLSRQDVRTGDMVKAGQQIGAVGETGISTAPHLHFEVHVNGTPVDPLQFFE